MGFKKIHTNQAPEAIGPYSQGYIAGEFLYTSGQGGIEPASGCVVEGGIAAQAEQTMQNLKAIFDEAGTSFESVVKTTCFLSDMALFADFNAVYEKYFVTRPARSCVAVKTLPLDILCEVEAVAYLGKKM